jgi:dephospho-CoA kinase
VIVIGLTGSIGMGKSTVARMFAEAGAPVFDADAVVHALYAEGGAAVEPVEQAFPGVSREGAIDRALLGARVLDDPAALARLERIVHPLVRAAQQRFLAEQRALGAKRAVLEIPLLFETGAAASVDRIVVVSAPPDLQKRRVLERPGMSEEKFKRLLALQTPDAEKRANADFVVDTGCALHETRAQVRAVLDALDEPG